MNTPPKSQVNCSPHRISPCSIPLACAAAIVLMTGLLGAPNLVAQDAPQGSDGGVAPSPGQVTAVRLSDVEGQVQLSQGSMILASQALNNTPVFEGTLITTSDDGRAELQFDDGSVVRVPPDSALLISVLRHDGGAAQSELDLQNGLAYFELQPSNAGDNIRVRFGNNVVTTSGFTVMRIRLDTPPGELAVFSGNANLEQGTALSLDLHGGESVNLNASNPSQYELAEAIDPDSWDEWNSDRDEALTTAEADRTQATNSQLDKNNPAWSDLDSNGNWYNVPGQGYVWSPYEAQNSAWDPYGCGNWMWTPNFNYIWVSCESWGYMPYMSGMWNYYPGFGWGWYPGYGGGGAWWSTGGWNYNVSPTYALRYSPPRRPRGGPVRPPEVSTFPVKAIYQPFPVLGVNRLRNFEHAAPLRPQGAPLTIAGREIQPLRPIAPRQRSDYSAFGGDSRHSQPVYPGTRTGQYSGFTAAPRNGMQSRPVFTAPANGYNGTVRMPSNTGTTMARPEASHYNYNAPRSISPSMPGRGPSAPSLRPSGGGGNSGGAPRSSGSSFGGGGGPARMGGGGGGGGAPHGSGGGSPHK